MLLSDWKKAFVKESILAPAESDNTLVKISSLFRTTFTVNQTTGYLASKPQHSITATGAICKHISDFVITP